MRSSVQFNAAEPIGFTLSRFFLTRFADLAFGAIFDEAVDLTQAFF